jgi:hypothetical protein
MAAAKLRSTLKSIDGAIRHAERMAGKPAPARTGLATTQK